MKYRHMSAKGQFSIIAALLISIIVVSAVIMTYANIRNLPFNEPPKVLSSIAEMNLALKGLLEFSTGYYGSILQVTGNVSYAKQLTSIYLQSGFTYIAQSNPSWNPSFNLKYSSFSTCWYQPTSYSMGNLSVTYSLLGLGTSQITYNTSSLLNVQILGTIAGQSNVRVTSEGNEPDLTLNKTNFFFYLYSGSSWNQINPSYDPTVSSNGTYTLQIPSGVDQTAYFLKVSDSRGMMTTAFRSNSGKPQYTYTFAWNTGLYSSSLTRDTIVVEALQNGTLRWLGQNIQLSTQGKAIPPIPVRALHVNQTPVNGISREVPFQVEDWSSNYQVPLGLTSNASLFGNRQMIVFLVNHNVQSVTLWWNGKDTATQTSFAWKNKYFTVNTGQRTLTNQIVSLKIDFSSSTFKVISTVGTTTSTGVFMRINNDVADYGSAEPNYAISNGTVRDVVSHEVEWGNNGVSGGLCPNVYAEIVLTLPANATYYTYASRLIFINSSQTRTISDLSPIQLSVSGASPSPRTENGTSGGYPVSSSNTGIFYNYTSFQNGWAHHWSEFISSGSSGAGIMFTDSANQKLYAFDKIAGQKTGALNVFITGGYNPQYTIEFNPVERYQASFKYPLDVTWHGAVATFNNDANNTIYPTSGNIGLWVIVESPPTVSVA
jgi:hypothetical protein